jgi:hypothetical protein
VPDILPRRRTLLASAAALPALLATAGCRSADVFAGPDPLAGPPPLSHDVITLQAVIAAEETLIQLYKAAIGGEEGATTPDHPLKPLLAQHEQHLVQLRARLVLPPGRPAAKASPAARPGAHSVRVTTARLREAERASAAGLVRRLATVEPALAQLFASIAASDATHVTALGGAG